MTRRTLIGFLDLPTEIRAMILEFLLVPQNHLLTFGICERDHNNISPQILQTSRQLLAEGVPFLYGRSTIRTEFSFDRSEKLFTNINRMNVRSIRKLELPADDDIDEIDESRDLIQGAKNLRLTDLLQDYPELANLQILSLYFKQEFPPSCNDWDPYFEKLGLWTKYERADRRKKKELNEIALQYAFKWTILRAVASVSQCRPELGHVYERVDDVLRVVFTRAPIYKAGNVPSDFCISTKSGKFTTLHVDVDNTTVTRGKTYRVKCRR